MAATTSQGAKIWKRRTDEAHLVIFKALYTLRPIQSFMRSKQNKVDATSLERRSRQDAQQLVLSNQMAN